MRHLVGIIFSFLISFLFSWTAFSVQDFETDPMQVQPLVKTSRIEGGQNFTIEIKTSLPKKFHAYSDQIRLAVKTPEGFQVSQGRISKEIEFFDKFSKKNRKGFQGETTLIFQVEAPLELTTSSDHLILLFSYQACSDTFCLFPLTKELKASVDVVGPAGLMGSLTQLTTEEGFAQALKQNLLLAFVLVFFAGILTSFTPCIYPMIPITLSVIGQNTLNRTRRESFFLSLFYVLGIAFTYSLLGVFAAMSGHIFGQWAGNKYVLGFMCVLFFTMALGIYGFYDVQVPLWIQNKVQRRGHQSHGYGPAFVIGMLSGLLASPCVGPVLVSILAFVASTKNAVLGFFILFVYALGLGMIFMALGLFSQLTKLLPKSGPWMNVAKFVLGSLMMTAFFYYLNQLVPTLVWDSVLVLALIAAAYFLGAFRIARTNSRYETLTRALGRALFAMAFIICGFAMTAQLVSQSPSIIQPKEMQGWLPYSEERLKIAKEQNKRVIIDFYADWCLACHELEEKTFSTEGFKKATENDMLLRFDATNDSDQLKELKKRYRIQGLPTVVFINRKGEILHPITLKNFEKEEAFLKRLNQVQ